MIRFLGAWWAFASSAPQPPTNQTMRPTIYKNLPLSPPALNLLSSAAAARASGVCPEPPVMAREIRQAGERRPVHITFQTGAEGVPLCI